MATNEKGQKHYLKKHAIVAALALLLAASAMSYALPGASAAPPSPSSASIRAIPQVSSHEKGTSVFLQISFTSSTANPIQYIQVVVDDTPSPHTLQFAPNGSIITGDSVFTKIIGRTVFEDHGGYGGNGKVIGHFLVQVAKKPLSVGVHNASLQVVLQGTSPLTASTSFTLTDPPTTPPDINARFLIAAGHVGKEVHAIAILTNDGGSATGKFQTTLYLSSDSTLDSSDKAIGMKIVGSMTAGSFRIVDLEGTLPANTHGSYYLIAMADSGNVVTESSETNNVASTPITIS